MNIKLHIEKIVHKGYGLSHHKKKTCFIPYTIDQELIEGVIKEEKKDLLYALPKQILKKSSYRIKPNCSLFQQCGGCDFQHIDYNHQIEIKKNIILEFLLRADIEYDKAVNFIRSPDPFYYRISSRFQIQKKQLGYYKKNSNQIIPVEDCVLLDKSITQFIKSIKELPHAPSLIIKTDNNNNISASNYQKRLQYSVDSLNIIYDHRTFFQANKFLIKDWLETIKNYAEPFNKKRIIDCYCGIGIITLFLAAHYNIKKITGIDSDNTAINYAKTNREKNKKFNVKFIAGKAERRIKEFESANIIVVNPPRTGISSEVINQILKIRPEAIIYSSCEISTFIRDSKILVNHGYQLDKLTGLDMFPQTYHFELVGLFIK